MKFDAFIFDMDCTLVSLGIPNHTSVFSYEWAKDIGMSEDKAVQFSKLKNRDERMAFLIVDDEAYVRDYLSKYPPVDSRIRNKLIDEKKLKLNQGAIELLESINKPKALVSQTPKEGVELIIKKFDLEKYFDFIFFRDYVASHKSGLRKPEPKLANLACEKMRVKPSKKVAMIGDSNVDLAFAKNSGLTSIIVFNDEIKGDFNFKNLTELHEWLS